MIFRILVACLATLVTVPSEGGADEPPSVGQSAVPVAETDVGLDAETIAGLEQQLESLNLLIDQQTRRLGQLHDKMDVETDSTKQRQLDGLISRMTALLDELEFQRDTLEEQITNLRQFTAETGNPDKK